MLVEIELEAVDHILANLSKDARDRCNETDAQFLRACLRAPCQAERKTTAQRYLLQSIFHRHSSLALIIPAAQFVLHLSACSRTEPLRGPTQNSRSRLSVGREWSKALCG